MHLINYCLGELLESKVLVETNNPFNLKPEELSPLVERLRELGQDADVAYHGPREPETVVSPDGEASGFYSDWLIEVTLWVGDAIGAAAISQIVNEATQWMKDYRSKDTDNRPINIIVVHGDAHINNVLSLEEGEDAEVIEKTPEAFESYTRTKPPAR